MITTLIVGSSVLYAGTNFYHSILQKYPKTFLNKFSLKRKKPAFLQTTHQESMPPPPENILDESMQTRQIGQTEQQKIVTALTATTAVIHITLGISASSLLFIINGIGFSALLTAHYFLPALIPYRQHTRDGLISYTGATIVSYFALQGVSGLVSFIGMFTKLVEVGIITALWHERQQATENNQLLTLIAHKSEQNDTIDTDVLDDEQYQTYIIHCWQEDSNQTNTALYRYSLEGTTLAKRRGFVDGSRLLEALQKQLPNNPSHS